jgi:hypothetical protein
VRAVNVIFTLAGTSNTTVAGATINPGLNLNATAQAAGSMGPRTVTGSITVDVNSLTAPTSIQFVSASIDPANFASNLQPAVGGGAGSAAAEFGFQFDLTPIGFPITEFVAWRNSVTTITSGSLAVNGSGNFSATGINFTANAGTVDFGGATNGTGNLNAIPSAGNVSAATGSYTVAGGLATLTVPNFDYTFITNFGGTPGTVHFTGSLTGTATVPEPALPALLLGASPLLLRRRRKC